MGIKADHAVSGFPRTAMPLEDHGQIELDSCKEEVVNERRAPEEAGQ